MDVPRQGNAPHPWCNFDRDQSDSATGANSASRGFELDKNLESVHVHHSQQHPHDNSIVERSTRFQLWQHRSVDSLLDELPPCSRPWQQRSLDAILGENALHDQPPQQHHPYFALGVRPENAQIWQQPHLANTVGELPQHVQIFQQQNFDASHNKPALLFRQWERSGIYTSLGVQQIQMSQQRGINANLDDSQVSFQLWQQRNQDITHRGRPKQDQRRHNGKFDKALGERFLLLDQWQHHQAPLQIQPTIPPK